LLTPISRNISDKFETFGSRLSDNGTVGAQRKRVNRYDSCECWVFIVLDVSLLAI
jgi:hypothetical protein